MKGFLLEAKKVLGDRRFWVFLVCLILLQCFFLYRGEKNGNGYAPSAYRNLYEQLQEMEPFPQQQNLDQDKNAVQDDDHISHCQRGEQADDIRCTGDGRGSQICLDGEGGAERNK